MRSSLSRTPRIREELLATRRRAAEVVGGGERSGRGRGDVMASALFPQQRSRPERSKREVSKEEDEVILYSFETLDADRQGFVTPKQLKVRSSKGGRAGGSSLGEGEGEGGTRLGGKTFQVHACGELGLGLTARVEVSWAAAPRGVGWNADSGASEAQRHGDGWPGWTAWHHAGQEHGEWGKGNPAACGWGGRGSGILDERLGMPGGVCMGGGPGGRGGGEEGGEAAGPPRSLPLSLPLCVWWLHSAAPVPGC